MIIKLLIYVYCIQFISMLFHEILHYILARAFKFIILKIKIGDDFYALKIKKLSISLLITNSYVEFIIPNGTSYNKAKVVYLAGGFGNMLLAIIFVALNKIVPYWHVGVAINILSLVISFLPIKFFKNDMFYLLKYKRNIL